MSVLIVLLVVAPLGTTLVCIRAPHRVAACLTALTGIVAFVLAAALVPTGTPKETIDQLNAWFAQVVDTPEARAFSVTIASDPWVTTPAEAQAYFLKDIARWGEYVKIAKIEPQG